MYMFIVIIKPVMIRPLITTNTKTKHECCLIYNKILNGSDIVSFIG